MADWTPDELDAIGAADELRITVPRGDGSAGRTVPIWVVRVDGSLYIRSYRGSTAGWYRRALAAGTAHVDAGDVSRDVVVEVPDTRTTSAIDREYRRKYAHFGGSYVTPMTALAAQEATLSIRPADQNAQPGRNPS